MTLTGTDITVSPVGSYSAEPCLTIAFVEYPFSMSCSSLTLFIDPLLAFCYYCSRCHRCISMFCDEMFRNHAYHVSLRCYKSAYSTPAQSVFSSVTTESSFPSFHLSLHTGIQRWLQLSESVFPERLCFRAAGNKYRTHSSYRIHQTIELTLVAGIVGWSTCLFCQYRRIIHSACVLSYRRQIYRVAVLCRRHFPW